MGCTTQDKEMDDYFDMNFFISKSSGIIQLNPIIPLEEIYKQSHGSGKIGSLWHEHHLEFAKFIKYHSPNSVLEIGGGSGILAQLYQKNYKPIDWLIVEPNLTKLDDPNIKVADIFFDENFNTDFNFDTIVHSHVFEHVFYPKIFLQNIKKQLSYNKKMIFSVPNLSEMFSRFYTNCINFEHTVLLTDNYIDFLLSQYNFKILDKKFFKEDHSIFYAVKLVDSNTKVDLSNNLYNHNKKSFLAYVNHFENQILSINNLLSDNKEIFLFGAHIFSQFLINRGLDISNIKGIIDNDLNKQKKRLYGTNLYVSSPKILKQIKNPTIILKVANYADEIKKDIINNINPNTTFIE